MANDGDACTVEHLMEALQFPAEQWEDGLHYVATAARARRAQRTEALVRAEDATQAANEFLGFLLRSVGSPELAMPIRFDVTDTQGGDARAADATRTPVRPHCDGEVIHLPAAVASFSREVAYRFYANYVPAHEWLPKAAGSFSCSLGTGRGRKLRNRLCRTFGKARAAEEDWKKTQTKLRSEGISGEALRRTERSDLLRYFDYFPAEDRHLVQWLVNAVEDGRLERIMAARWPGLVALHEEFDACERRMVAPSPLGMTAHERLIGTIGMRLAERSAEIPLDAAQLLVVERCEAMGWLAAAWEGQGATIEVFGGIDGGPRLARLVRAPSASAQSLAGFEAVGFGGFRLGPTVRALVERPTALELPPIEGEHLVLAFTDGEAGYVGREIESLVDKRWRNNCTACARKDACIVEISPTAIGARSSPPPAIFDSLSRQLRDVRDAAEQAEAAGARFHTFVFNNAHATPLWDELLGSHRWTMTLSPADMLPALTRTCRGQDER